MLMRVGENSIIEADNIIIGKNVSFGKDINIRVRGEFSIGDDSRVGDRFTAVGENIRIGKHFYNGPTDSRGMVIGGGSANFPFADLTIGDRCTCHTGHINLSRPVVIGNDVGLSHDVDIITHGFWASILEGYPYAFDGVTLGNNVIVGWKTVIMTGVTIANDVVIGAHSTVVKNLSTSRAIYAGSPAKFIREITMPSEEKQIELLNMVGEEFKKLISFYKQQPTQLEINFPYIKLNDMVFNAKTLTCEGEHDVITDAFRDFSRRYGLRFYCDGRNFAFKLDRK
jgi:acetyltransferase-like isoleucine patch superfamily enzyme